MAHVAPLLVPQRVLAVSILAVGTSAAVAEERRKSAPQVQRPGSAESSFSHAGSAESSFFGEEEVGPSGAGTDLTATRLYYAAAIMEEPHRQNLCRTTEVPMNIHHTSLLTSTSKCRPMKLHEVLNNEIG